MILFIIGALFVLIALAILIFSDDAKRTAIIPAVVAVIFIGISCVSYVPTGYTGIVTTFGKVEDGTKDAGVVLKAPWQSIVKMDNRVQEMSMDLSAFSSDIQEVSTSVAVGYRINQANAMTIYKEVGKKYEDTLITPRVLETVKAVVAHYDASSLISNRDAVASQMDTKLREVLAQYNIDLQYISVTNFDFTDTFTDAVEAKVKAQQEKEKAETDADKRRVEAQATADADLIAANAEAEKSKVAADAELYGLHVEAVPVKHASDMKCCGLLICDEEETTYFSADASELSDDILQQFKQGKIQVIYHDCTFLTKESPSHCSLKRLCEYIPPEMRNRVYCMHFGGDFMSQIKEAGFQVVTSV